MQSALPDFHFTSLYVDDENVMTRTYCNNGWLPISTHAQYMLT